MTFSPANFLEAVADGTEAVTLGLVRSASTANVSIAHALRGPLTRRLAALQSTLQLEGDETVFQISAAELNPNGEGRTIRQGDTITDASNAVFIVQSAALTTMRTRWEIIATDKQ